LKKYLISLFILTVMGLVIVHGEIAAIRTGYEVRQMNITKQNLMNSIKQLEAETSILKTPRRLENWMTVNRVNLNKPQYEQLARADTRQTSEYKDSFLTKLFWGTARADTER
jgi:hypothetical protein